MEAHIFDPRRAVEIHRTVFIDRIAEAFGVPPRDAPLVTIAILPAPKRIHNPPLLPNQRNPDFSCVVPDGIVCRGRGQCLPGEVPGASAIGRGGPRQA